MIVTTNPRTGVSSATDLALTSTADVDCIVKRAEQAAPDFVARGRESRARMLDGVADSLDAARDALIQPRSTTAVFAGGSEGFDVGVGKGA
jgi:NADP-dependent aldehyde dehydrogenase